MAITDRRVQKMNEILNSIKFIKMYAWVKAFAQDIRSRCSPRTRPLPCSPAHSDTTTDQPRVSSGIRDEERRILEMTGYFQSITVGVAPIVVVIASVATFSTHLLLGYNLTAAQVSPSSSQTAQDSRTSIFFLLPCKHESLSSQLS